MLISYKWLLDYLPKEVDYKQLASILTDIGLEVEEINTYQSNTTTFDKVVVGQIKLIDSIKGASKIRLAKVKISTSEEPASIVCGADNIVEGAWVAVALPGARLTSSAGETTIIKKAKIRGVHSFGMICAAEELGLDIEHEEGVWLLDNEVPAVGTPLSDYIDVYTDVLLKINLMPNRGDVMSYLGIARDVCAYWTYHTGKLHTYKLPSAPPISKAQKDSCGISVHVKDKTRCLRYSGLTVENVTISSSPSWMQDRLKAVGVNTISNVVDISNYVMRETGQPLHIFDRNKITAAKVHVQTMGGQSFVTLDGKERTLSDSDLVIADAEKPMCIAGVFGGIHSGVQDKTKNLFIESACFHPQSIRATSIRHQLRTEAALRYEKGTDVEGTLFALERTADLLKQYANARITREIVDVCSVETSIRKMEFECAYAEKLAGTTYNFEKVKEMLSSLGFGLQVIAADLWELTIPSYRLDIIYPADIVEEIIRMDGLNNIPIPNKTVFSTGAKPLNTASKLQNYLSDLLCGMGFFEVLHNSIVQRSQYENADHSKIISLLNSLSTEHNALRPSMMESGLSSVLYNVNRKRGHFKFFEFGTTYHKEGEQFVECSKCAFWVVGNWQVASWKTPAIPSTFYHLAGLLGTLFCASGGIEKHISKTQKKDERYAQCASFHNGKTAWGFAGELNTNFLKKVGIKQAVWYAEVDMDYVTSLYKTKVTTYKQPSRFPDVVRDLAFFVGKDIAYQKIMKSLYALNMPLLHSVALFDLYDNIKDRPKKQSVALRFTFRSYEKTLEEEDIKQLFGHIIKTLEAQWKVSIRSATE